MYATTIAPLRPVPRGVGVYARALRDGVVGTPHEFAQRARAAGLSFVPLLAVWDDQRGFNTPNDDALVPYADALRSVGIDVWVWGYPKAHNEAAFVDALVSRARLVHAQGVIVDPEVSYRRRPDAMARLVSLTLDALDESLGVGFTSFGLPNLHRDFPWREAGALGWGSPQLYSQPPRRAVEGIGAWRSLGWTTQLPALPTFGAASTRSSLDALVDAVIGEEGVNGLLFWSWNSASTADFRAIARAAAAIRARDVAAAQATAARGVAP